MKLKRNIQYSLALCFLCLFVPFNLLAQAPPPPTVTVTIIEKKPATQTLYYLGRVEAIHAVDVLTRTEGFIEKVHFKEGQMVKAGDLLFEINPDVHLSEIDQAKARLASANASLNLATVTFQRIDALARSRATSRADADQAQADRDVARANVLQAEAALRARELILSFTKITAPVAGRIGHTRFDVGSFINLASGSLVNIVQLDPIRVVIGIRERDFITASSGGSDLKLDILGKDFAPKLRLANGSIFPTRGVFDSIDNRINTQVGTVDVRARFNNPDNILLPGGAVDVTIDAQEPPLVEVVPIVALQQDREGFFVLVVNDDNSFERRRVKLGIQLEQEFVVREGLKVGEKVIIEGLQRVRPDVPVNPIIAPLAPRLDQ
ncbi:efflux RND transporter periplasmic adaptor subunit [Desulfovibrio litoralis]|uniref:RND family efflux transporter, MFP subunit n=1 Tax=Desulfovibrio litoralis DSM 11393 TaxID=1121455 RepID=A0A1M7S997_9BACT|nr:efflux RND transporter periplasmic adaptor subunit [Desulfovibrio litoralis]SHN55239.1 RND family efflux transporter, MFP subunit [Desulfovibrio litoralis DSM 11393]